MGHLRAHSRRACHRNRGRRPLGWAIALLLSLAPLSGQADPPSLPEYAIKAAYLYQFSSFIAWPPESVSDPGTPFCICVLGSDPFGPLLDSLERKTVQGREVAIRRMPQLQEPAGCHILFVSASEAPRVDRILEALGTQPIVTVGDLPGFAQAGGIIEFVRHQNNIRFTINLDSARRAGLKISSKLLSLATVVRQGPGNAER
jgi:hypothetical protein